MHFFPMIPRNQLYNYLLYEEIELSKCNEHWGQILLKLFMKILIWHSKDNTHFGPHQWNVNFWIESVTTSSRNNWVGLLTVSRTFTNKWRGFIGICSMLRNYSGLGFKIRRERANKIHTLAHCKYPWAY